MRIRIRLLALALTVLPLPANAHRLDEYLQATTITVAREAVTVRVALTPGISIAPAVLGQIDADGDGTISPTEGQRYAAHESNRLRLTIDGAPARLQLRSWAFATSSALRSGVGDIVLTMSAPIAPGAAHQLVLEHPHPDAQAVYLVNTLVPADPAVRVVAQDRSYDQSRYRLDIAIAPARLAARPTESLALSPAPASAPIIATFFVQGVRHILTGYDHLLFVAALVLGAMTLWDLIKIVSAFTLAHSITLMLAALGLVRVPSAVVEPVIAASIVAVAVQTIVRPGQASGSRLALAFVFGLFHGLGFAGGLLDLMHAMPGAVMLSAILGFSLGVEVGQQIVLLPLFAAIRALARRADTPGWPSPYPIQRFGSIVVAVAGLGYLGAAILSV